MLVSIARLLSREILGLTSLDGQIGEYIYGIPILGNDNALGNYSPTEVELVNAIGSVDIPRQRSSLFIKFRENGYSFASLIHPTAIISESVQLEEGVQIAAGVIIQTGCHLGVNTIVNTGAILDHNCSLGSHSHVAPSVTLSGGVKIGEKCHIGVGATFIQERSTGPEVLVAAGAVVTRDLSGGKRYKGIPARSY